MYEQDYLNAEEMDLVIRGKGLGDKDKAKVRTWDTEKYGPAVLQLRQ